MAPISSGQHKTNREYDAAETGPPTARMSRGEAMLLKIFGPADRPDNPLVGTRYDPARAAREYQSQFRRRRDRSMRLWRRWDKMLRGHNPVPPWDEAIASRDTVHDRAHRKHDAAG